MKKQLCSQDQEPKLSIRKTIRGKDDDTIPRWSYGGSLRYNNNVKNLPHHNRLWDGPNTIKRDWPIIVPFVDTDIQI